ncbi:voltage-gated potassium channel [Reichenbachiella faecimaris]|uniref:Voltage-gated potassium channel n=1 Tax=Reichenbachiella faecimaris TaxID=692418 RepID=A0A1W2G993_REIFA|nr:potassium channel protein [Reichenbachiella faecimaris]SMD33193.1 voltage-gated potassium channel [Reichenbachiella faecimaris]
MLFLERYRDFRKLFISAFLLIASLCTGMLGFVMIEGFSWVESFYMAVITFSTVGFNEIYPLSENGRLFTSIYIIFNLMIFAYVVSVFSTYLFEGELNRLYRKYVFGKEVKKMKDHIIVCGFGRNGSRACEELRSQKVEFVVVDRDEQLIDIIQNVKKYKFILGDPTQEEVLEEAGIGKAKALITTLPSDAENVFLTLTAKELNPEVRIISRASEENTIKKLKQAGAQHVIMPDAIGGLHMAQHITKPFVIEYLDQLSGHQEDGLTLEEVRYEDLRSDFQGQTIESMDIRNRTDVTVVGLNDKHGKFVFNPSSKVIMEPGVVLVIVGTYPKVQDFKSEYLK